MELQRLGTALFDMVRRIDDAQGRAARQQKLHPTDFGCIGFLHREAAPVSPKQIIAHLGLTSSSGTALLDRLEGIGYIRRMPNPEDRRSVLIALDADVAAEPIAQYLRMQAKFSEVTRGFDDRDLHVIADFIERLARLPHAAEADGPTTPSIAPTSPI